MIGIELYNSGENCYVFMNLLECARVSTIWYHRDPRTREDTWMKIYGPSNFSEHWQKQMTDLPSEKLIQIVSLKLQGKL